MASPASVAAVPPTGALLFDAAFLRRLEQLELLARRVPRGGRRGERLTQRRGRGLEFSDFRPYQAGDDLRHVDWNVSARLDRLFLKLYAAEEDVTVYVLLDASASMAFGAPAKFDHARRLGAALAYVALLKQDRVVLATFGDGPGTYTPALKSRRALPRVLTFLAEREAAGGTCLAAALRDFVWRARRPGLVLLIADLLGESAPALIAGLDVLRHAGHEVVLLQVLDEAEVDPPLDGDLRLLDAEDGSALVVSVDGALRGAYQARLAAHLRELEDYTRRAGHTYLRATTAIPFEDLLLRYLRGAGPLR